MDSRVWVSVMEWDQQNPISLIAIKLFSELLTWFTSAVNPVTDSYLMSSQEAAVPCMSNRDFLKTIWPSQTLSKYTCNLVSMWFYRPRWGDHQRVKINQNSSACSYKTSAATNEQLNIFEQSTIGFPMNISCVLKTAEHPVVKQFSSYGTRDGCDECPQNMSFNVNEGRFTIVGMSHFQKVNDETVWQCFIVFEWRK